MDLYQLDFTEEQQEEINSLPATFESGNNLPRMLWLAIAYQALGKAQMIDKGRYDMGDDDDADNPAWAEELREIARVILDKFQPGDGQL